MEDFDLHKQLYKGKASLLYSASCRKSNMPVAVKVYRKARLSELNWYQVNIFCSAAPGHNHALRICLKACNLMIKHCEGLTMVKTHDS